MSLPDPAPGIVVGSHPIAAAADAEQLPSVAARLGHDFVLKARRTNTGYCYPASTKALAEAQHFEMAPGDALRLDIDNLNRLWVDVSVNGEYVEWVTEAR